MMVGMVSAILALQAVMVPAEACRNKDEGKVEYFVYPNDTLPGDVQVTAWLRKGEEKRFFYTSPSATAALSLTISTCTSPLSWTFAPAATAPTLTLATTTRHFPPAKGPFTLGVVATERDTFAHVYVSTEVGGPQALRSANFAKLKLLKRQKGKRLTVKWNPSLVDPRFTTYCLITTPTPFHGTLCSAQTSNTSVSCVGRRTHHTASSLKQNQKYHFTVFATNHQSNLTYAYGTTAAIFDGRFRHTSLKDGKASFANLKKLDGKAVFRYKVGNDSKTLDFFVLPCGGVVDVEVTLKDVTIIGPKHVESFDRLTVENPEPSSRYYLKIFALDKEELKRTSGVEVYATTRYPAKIPLPGLPRVAKITEYPGLTTCDSVTVGWLAAPNQKNVHYCVSAKEGKIRESENYRMPNQCGLENRLKKSTDFAVKFCTDVKPDKKSVIVRKIGQLKPARSYIVQITVKKSKGKTLSYDLLQVRTRPTCERN